MRETARDRQLDANLRRLPEARAGAGFTEAVLARLDALDAAAKRPADGWLAPLPRLAATAAVLAAAVGLGFVLGQPSTAPAPRPQPAPAATPTTPATLPDGAQAVARPTVPSPGIAPRSGVGTAPASPAAGGERPAPRRRGEVRTAALPTGAARHPTAGAVDHQEAVRRLAELRREQQRLRADLATLAAAERPTLLLGGDETVELVLDFDRTAAGGVRPASWRPN